MIYIIKLLRNNIACFKFGKILGYEISLTYSFWIFIHL